MQETQIKSVGWEDPLEKAMATHSSILAWEVPWTEKSGGYSPWSCNGLQWSCNNQTQGAVGSQTLWSFKIGCLVCSHIKWEIQLILSLEFKFPSLVPHRLRDTESQSSQSLFIG